MNRPGHNNTKFFLGREVEVTPAHGRKTLFVVGIQPTADIQGILNDPFTSQGGKVEQIYFGANQSFPRISPNDAEAWNAWETMIRPFLEQGYTCALDLDVVCVDGLTESILVEYNNFIPMISVKLPYIGQLGYNAVLKLDDRDFAATNPGVWCHQVHTLMQRDRFTPWSAYTKDEVI